MKEDNRRLQRNNQNLTHHNGITQATKSGENLHEFLNDYL
jgi:hypothetical protein